MHLPAPGLSADSIGFATAERSLDLQWKRKTKKHPEQKNRIWYLGWIWLPKKISDFLGPKPIELHVQCALGKNLQIPVEVWKKLWTLESWKPERHEMSPRPLFQQQWGHFPLNHNAVKDKLRKCYSQSDITRLIWPRANMIGERVASWIFS